MGQKVNPRGLRMGINVDWSAHWYADKKNFGEYLKEDYEIRKALSDRRLVSLINERVKTAEDRAASKTETNFSDRKANIERYGKKSGATVSPEISRIDIRRAPNHVIVDIFSGRPGVLIGRNSVGIPAMKELVTNIVGKDKKVSVNVAEVRKVDANAQLIAEGIATSLEARMPFRRAMKQGISKAIKAGVLGVKTMVSGRLNGREIASSECYSEGSIPLQTLRADIDYGFAEALTTYGILGAKVWIYNGEILAKKDKGGANRNVDA